MNKSFLLTVIPLRYVFLMILTIYLVTLGFPVLSEEEKLEVGVRENLSVTVPLDSVFTATDGKKYTLKSLINNKPTVIGFVYYKCPGVCNIILGGMAEVLEQLDMTAGKDYSVIALSFNHHEDIDNAKEKQKEYLGMLGDNFPKDQWSFLIGDQANILKLTQAAGYYFKEDKDGFFMHPSALIVVTPQGKISRYLYGNEYLPLDLKMALIEASQEKTSPAIAKIMKFCFSYDPEGKKYVFNTTKVAGIIILTLILIFFIFLVYKKKS